jgi:undecaprenyl pyrophosphate phosphatase UppP
MYLIAFPLLLVPFVLYNMIIFLLNMPFSEVVFSIPLMSERRLPVTTSDLLVMLGMLLLYLEVLKAARLGSKGVMDHVLSFALFVGMAAELALVPRAMTPTLLLLTTLAFVDVIIGVSFIGRRKQREIVLEDDGQAHEGSQQGR